MMYIVHVCEHNMPMQQLNPLVLEAHYSERQDKPFSFFTNSTVRSRFKVKLRIFIFCTLGTNGLRGRFGHAVTEQTSANAAHSPEEVGS